MLIAEILGDGGRIAAKLPGYEVRPQQLEMAEAVAAAFDAGEHLFVEAGTGVGKTFAYLIPAIEQVMKHGGRAVISTHTIALQEQIVDKDIPFLQTISPDPFSAVLVKGRSNYLGLRRLARTSSKQDQLFASADQKSQLWAVEDWAYKTEDGSLADLDPTPNMGVWERVRSDADDCHGRKCQHYAKCFYQRARRRAVDAQILIVNHSLLLADVALRQQGASILPDYDYLVLDEAHTVERVAGQHMGVGISSAQVHHLLNTLHHERTGRGVLGGRSDRILLDAVAEARRAADAYFDDLAEWHSSRAGWNGRLREPPPIDQPVTARMVTLCERLRELRDELDDEADKSEIGGLIERARDIGASVNRWSTQEVDGMVYWLAVIRSDGSRRQRVTLNARPIDVGPHLKAALFDQVKSVVMTSATLTTASKEAFAYVGRSLGVEETNGLKLGSPFDYRQQLKVYVEAGLPDPSDYSAFTSAACDAIKKYVDQTAGRAFVLFTSYSMLRSFAERLEGHFEKRDMTLFVQGAGMQRSAMLNEFRSTERSVLFGTDTFWTGVDVPGEALSNVIIVKLPFAVPSDPLVEAKIERIKESGGNSFMSFQVPDAILKFRQGVGRLIRSRRDEGIVVILDPRVQTKQYGRMFLKALPDCEVIVVGNR